MRFAGITGEALGLARRCGEGNALARAARVPPGSFAREAGRSLALVVAAIAFLAFREVLVGLVVGFAI